jgi:hypothetical protein
MRKINDVDNNGVDSIWNNVMLTSSYLVSFVTFKLTLQFLLKTRPTNVHYEKSCSWILNWHATRSSWKLLCN